MIKEETITLKIDEKNSLKFLMPCQKKILHCCLDCKINLETNTQTYLLHNSDTTDALESFKVLLREAINEESHLPESINLNIGFLWNEYIQDKTKYNFETFDFDGRPEWVGSHFSLWWNQNIASWLYNDKDSIILEITPTYPWIFRDPEEGENFISYEEFIKNYQPLVKIRFDKEIAQKFLEQAEEILDIIYKNNEINSKLSPTGSLQ